ncbi:MAG: tryptophan--tRNA ligase, partial [Angelakisella sp.]
DDPSVIVKKFRSAVTDSEAKVRYGEGKAGINNLICIYSVMTGKSFEAIEQEFDGKGYGDFKTAVGESVAVTFAPIQQRYRELMEDKGYLESCYHNGAAQAAAIAQRTLQKVYKKVGYIL